MDKTDISIVIVNYNVKDFLLQCLRSIDQSKTELNVETIVVDNNSIDASVEELSPIFPNVKFISTGKNLGFGKANNIGFRESIGKYILILNPDTILEDNTLRKMFDFMESNPDIGISGCKVLNPDGTFQLACRRGFPTPWASFSKLFGLQSLFPKSRLFAKYNQTFRSIDDTYEIDAVIGAFMFCRKETIDAIDGFDEDFFMYAEDIDLCFRAKNSGWKIVYYHETSIIHFKGESTRRSSINSVKHFYKAMEIFAEKHYGKSVFFLSFLRFGIILRTLMAYLSKYRRDIFIILTDMIGINLALLLSTKYRFGEFFNFPEYAYPTVFIVISVVLFVSMVASGEYFENNPTVRKSTFSHLSSFFILSTMTYFFKEEYGFSRGILLMTSGLGIAFSTISRILLSLFDNLSGSNADKKIAIVGINNQTGKFVKALQSAESMNVNIVGLIRTKSRKIENIAGIPEIGHVDYLSSIIEDKKIKEIIITDPELSKTDIIKIISGISNPRVKFHVAHDYEDLVSSKIIDNLSVKRGDIEKSNLAKLRYQLIKRLADIGISVFLLTIGLPIVYLFANYKKVLLRKLVMTLKGDYSVVGIYPVEKETNGIAKPGIISIAGISRPESLAQSAIKKLNDYYVQNYSFLLDTDICLKYLFRKNRGK